MKKEDKAQKRTKMNWKQFVRFLFNAKLAWLLIIVTMFSTIVYSEISVHLPGSTAALFSGDFSTVAVVSLLINYVASLVVSSISNLLSIYANTKSVRSIRRVAWKKMMHIDTMYYAHNDPSYLLSSLTNDSVQMVNSLIMAMTMIPASIYMVIRSFTKIAGFSTKLMFMLFALTPLYLLYGIFVGRWQRDVSEKTQHKIGKLTGYLTERLRNMSLIKSFATEKLEEKNGTETTNMLYKAKMRTVYLNTFTMIYVNASDIAATCIAVLGGSMLLKNGEITVEQWLEFFLMVAQVNVALRMIFNILVQFRSTQGYAARLSVIMDASQETDDSAGKTASPFTNGDIVFNDVSFSYDKSDVLKKLNITIPKGKSTALIGLSGCGKTTILSLMERFYAPASGTITLGGTPIRDINLMEYRKHFAYVQQDAGVFSGSIRDIITYGVDRVISEKELEEVAKLSGVLDYINTLPARFDTQMAVWGNSLSGGQRQKLVISRELLKNADILLFDEPTSALDASNTKEVQDTILRVFKGKTIIMVTHDLSLIASVDQIAIVNEGHVEACGKNEELIQESKLYRELVEEQSYQEVFEL